MKKLILLTIFLCSAGAIVYAQEGMRVCGSDGYVSLGAGLMKGKAKADFGVLGDKSFSDTAPAFKGAIGFKPNPSLRTELFYQYRDNMTDTKDVFSVKTRAQDFGANLFYTFNPLANTRFFIGAGLAATHIKPDVKSDGIAVEPVARGLFLSQFAYIGMEFPLNGDIDLDLTAFASKTLVHQDGLENLTALGLMLNMRFKVI